MHRGCAILSTDIFELLDFPDLSSISIKGASAVYDEGFVTANAKIDTVLSNDTPKIGNYDDLFNASPEKSAQSANLFDDYPKSPSKADDLFSDYQKTASSDNIFDDYQKNPDNIFDDYQAQENSIQLENQNILDVTSAKPSSESLSETFELQDAIRIGFETRQLIVLKKCIIMRILAV